MEWQKLNDVNQLGEIGSLSEKFPVLIFKHSTRCSISRAALDRLERKWNPANMQHVKPYFLDLLSFRTISDKIAELFQVEHQSPQLLLIAKNKVILDQSHFEISYEDVERSVKNPG